MAEYWKSTPKYWCKHCRTYVRDTGYERTQHEATGKHQGNIKRFLRDIHRSKEKEEKESQRAKNEVLRLKGLVAGSESPGPGNQQQQEVHQEQLGSRRGGAPSSSTSHSVNSGERKRQMAQLVEMGVAIPEEFRPEMALAGEWQTVAEPESAKDSGSGAGDMASATAVGVRKRKKRPGEEGGEDLEGEGPPVRSGVRKTWGSGVQQYPGPGDDDDDLDALLGMTSELKSRKGAVKSEVKAEQENEAAAIKQEDDPSVKEEPEGDSASSSMMDAATKAKDEVKPEEEQTKSVLQSVPEATTTDEPAVMFKKRKPKQPKR